MRRVPRPMPSLQDGETSCRLCSCGKEVMIEGPHLPFNIGEQRCVTPLMRVVDNHSSVQKYPNLRSLSNTSSLSCSLPPLSLSSDGTVQGSHPIER